MLGFEADFFVSPEVLVSANTTAVIGNTLVVINPAVAYLREDIIYEGRKKGHINQVNLIKRIRVEFFSY